MLRRLALFLSFCSMGFAKPVIGTDGIVNVASYQPSGFPNSGIAQGSIFVVFGSGLGPATLAQNGGFPLQTELSGTSMDITVSGTTTHAVMIYTSAGQVAAILPSSTPTGKGTLTLTYNGSASDPAPIQVVSSSLGIFTVNEGGTGPGVVTFPNSSTAVSLLDSAAPGKVYTLWGTGLGPVSGDETEGAAGGDMTKSLNVKLYVGNQAATVQYAGRSPGSTGLDQINFVVPSNVSGCFVPIAVSVKGVVSNFASIAIASKEGSMCSDPEGPLNQILQKVASGDNVRLGLMQLSRFGPQFNIAQLGTVTVNEDTASGAFYNITPQQFMGSLGVAPLDMFGGCAVWTCRGGTCIPPAQGVAAQLDAGSSLSVTGPNGTKQIPKTSSGYAVVLGGGDLTTPDFLDKGSYSLSGPGGSGSNAVGSFSVSQSIASDSSPVQWTSSQQSTIKRSQDVTVSWSGGSTSGYVVIIGASTTGSSDNTAGQVTGTVACTAKGASGTYTIPSWVLSALPVTGTLTESGITVSNGFLLMGLYPSFNSFNASGLDFGFFSNLVLSGQNVQYQ